MRRHHAQKQLGQMGEQRVQLVTAWIWIRNMGLAQLTVHNGSGESRKRTDFIMT